MPVSRRALLLSALAGGGAARAAKPDGAASNLIGVASFSYAARLGRDPELRDPIRFLQFCRQRGAGGVQTPIPARDEGYAAGVRRFLDESGMWLEGSVRLPRDRAEVGRFEADVRAAKAAGAGVLRTVMLAGRRYETFSTADEYRRFKQSSAESVALAAPVAARHRVRLAVENHKDYRSDELVELLRQVSSEYVGVTVDTGNNLALLEDPMETVEALAPFAFTVHLKDMAVEECPQGFLLSEVEFGRGFLDLPGITATLRKHRPDVRFNVEMATRDPLLIPCLTDRYWATFAELPGKTLARALSLVRSRTEGRPLPRVSALPPEERVAKEDASVKACLEYATTRLQP
jgi:sugar phosphate isomerase/epimerase